jgi:hypothetical protein
MLSEIIITADLVMFDGLPGRVSLGEFPLDGSPTRWVSWPGMGGGYCSFENREWVRLDLDGSGAAAVQHQGKGAMTNQAFVKACRGNTEPGDVTPLSSLRTAIVTWRIWRRRSPSAQKIRRRSMR